MSSDMSSLPVRTFTRKLQREFDTERLADRIEERLFHEHITQVFPNCPRYIHKMQLVERSSFVPRADAATPVPAWKRMEWSCDVLPRNDPTLKARL